MATIVNTPAASHDHAVEDSGSNSMMNLLIGVVVILIVAAMLFYFVLPAIRTAAAPIQAPGANAPQINVPDKVNVDVNPNAGGGAPAQK